MHEDYFEFISVCDGQFLYDHVGLLEQSSCTSATIYDELSACRQGQRESYHYHSV